MRGGGLCGPSCGTASSCRTYAVSVLQFLTGTQRNKSVACALRQFETRELPLLAFRVY